MPSIGGIKSLSLLVYPMQKKIPTRTYNENEFKGEGSN
jgi:hypothetical protein